MNRENFFASAFVLPVKSQASFSYKPTWIRPVFTCGTAFFGARFTVCTIMPVRTWRGMTISPSPASLSSEV
jgi:hypothetical protein